MKKNTGFPHIDKPWMKYYEGMHIPEKEPELNMVDVLKNRNKWRGKKIAYEYYGKRVTYDEMWKRVDDASRVLTKIGVKKGEIVLTMVPNIPEEEELWFGATQIGAIFDYIDPRPDSMDILANAKKLLEIIKFERPKYIISIDMCYPLMIKPIEEELKELGINDVIILRTTDSLTDEGYLNYVRDMIDYKRLSSGDSIIEDTITLDELADVLSKVAEIKEQNYMLDSIIKTSQLNVQYYVDLVKECQEIRFESVHNPDLVNYIGHTSGTSGARPKPITLTNRNAIASIVQVEIAGVGPKEGETSLHLLPGFAPFGRYNNGIQTYYNRGTNIHIPEFVLGEFGYLLKRYRPNAIMTPPSFLLSLPSCKYLEDEDLSYLNKVIYGGDSMTYNDECMLNEWLNSRGSHAEVEKGHGMSEFCGCGSYAKDAYNKPNTIGIPAPKTIYTIVEPEIEDKLVPVMFTDEMDVLRGEIAVSADHVTEGVLHGNVIIPHQDLEGKSYIRTRDIGYMDRDGCFFIDERKGRSFARIDGYKIKPSEIEKNIEENTNVKYARIVPYYDETIKGTMPICHVVLNNNNLNDTEQIAIVRDIVYSSIIGNETMNSRQIPSKFRIRSHMPLNKGGKVDFKALEEEGLSGNEISVIVNETNVAVSSIEILK